MGTREGAVPLSVRLVEFVRWSVVSKCLILALVRQKQGNCCLVEFGASFGGSVSRCLKVCSVVAFIWELNPKSFKGL